MSTEGTSAKLVESVPQEALDRLLRDTLDLLHVEQDLLGAELVKQSMHKLDSPNIRRDRGCSRTSAAVQHTYDCRLTLEIRDVVVYTSGGRRTGILCDIEEQLLYALFLELSLRDQAERVDGYTLFPEFFCDRVHGRDARTTTTAISRNESAARQLEARHTYRCGDLG